MLSRHSSRTDLSSSLIHFTKEAGDLDAFEVLHRILREKRLLGTSGFVKGGTPCVSFTEAPVDVLAAGMKEIKSRGRYSPFGLRFSKAHIFGLGGRPVIYQPDAEFVLLPAELRWRHVRFEPNAEAPIDWTWEREWRLACDGVRFTEREVEVVVPDDAAAEQCRRRFARDAHNEAHAWTVVLGDLAWGYAQPANWKVLAARRGDASR